MIKKIQSNLASLDIRENDNLLIHSSFISFGVMSESMEDIVNCLIDMVGPHAILAFPAFTFKNKGVFDKFTPPDNSVGALSKYVFDSKKYYRNLCPIHSYMFIGKGASLIEKNKYKYIDSFGDNSAFKFMEMLGFKQLLIGCGFSKCSTYIHHCERQNNVHYRNNMELSRFIDFNDGRGPKLTSVNYYSKDNDMVINSFDRLDNDLHSKYTSLFSENDHSRSSCIDLGVISSFLGRRIAIDKDYLLIKK
jgi:aminoglycoside N3'-acetyltransferase